MNAPKLVVRTEVKYTALCIHDCLCWLEEKREEFLIKDAHEVSTRTALTRHVADTSAKTYLYIFLNGVFLMSLGSYVFLTSICVSRTECHFLSLPAPLCLEKPRYVCPQSLLTSILPKSGFIPNFCRQLKFMETNIHPLFKTTESELRDSRFESVENISVNERYMYFEM